MKIAIYGPNLPVPGEAMHVHAEGCSDTNRGLYQRERPWIIEATTIQQVVFDIYPPNDFDYEPSEWEDFASDVKFFSCVKSLKGIR